MISPELLSTPPWKGRKQVKCPFSMGKPSSRQAVTKTLRKVWDFFLWHFLLDVFPPLLLPVHPHAGSVLVVNPAVATGAFRGWGSKPVAVLWAVAWVWDINSALGAAMKASSTVVDHKELLLSHRYFLPSLFPSAAPLWGVTTAAEVTMGESPLLLPPLPPFLLWGCHFCLNFNCKSCYITIYLLCAMSHCLHLLLFASPLPCPVPAGTARLPASLSRCFCSCPRCSGLPRAQGEAS